MFAKPNNSKPCGHRNFLENHPTAPHRQTRVTVQKANSKWSWVQKREINTRKSRTERGCLTKHCHTARVYAFVIVGVNKDGPESRSELKERLETRERREIGTGTTLLKDLRGRTRDKCLGVLVSLNVITWRQTTYPPYTAF